MVLRSHCQTKSKEENSEAEFVVPVSNFFQRASVSNSPDINLANMDEGVSFEFDDPIFRHVAMAISVISSFTLLFVCAYSIRMKTF